MADVTVALVEERPDEDLYRVRVGDPDGSWTEHLVTVKHAHREAISAPGTTGERILRASFSFLLAREPKESIFRAFDLREVNDYFHEFDGAMGRELGGARGPR